MSGEAVEAVLKIREGFETLGASTAELCCNAVLTIPALIQLGVTDSREKGPMQDRVPPPPRRGRSAGEIRVPDCRFPSMYLPHRAPCPREASIDSRAPQK